MNKYRLRRHRFWVVLSFLSLIGLLLANPTPQSLEKLSDLWSDYLKYDLGFSGDYKPDFDNLELLDKLAVKGRAPKTGYSREQFGHGWSKHPDGCDTRNKILKRDLVNTTENEKCQILTGTLNDPYTGSQIEFSRSINSSAVQIDHVVALSDAWQKGAQQISSERRVELANDPLNLLAADGPANQQKGDSDAASWLPENRTFRCQYIDRQIRVKQKYNLWVTEAEKSAMTKILSGC